jgi:hypothetical protein
MMEESTRSEYYAQQFRAFSVLFLFLLRALLHPTLFVSTILYPRRGVWGICIIDIHTTQEIFLKYSLFLLLSHLIFTYYFIYYIIASYSSYAFIFICTNNGDL